MNIREFGKFSSSFGVIKSPCKLVAEDFLRWQREILKPWGFEIDAEGVEILGDALNSLNPRTSPIVTKYLFWPFDESWTLYFDNGVNGTDAGPPAALAGRLNVDSMRVVMDEEIVEPRTNQIVNYRATILEYYCGRQERRHIFVANDGGTWKFGQSGEPFWFEQTTAYKARSVKDRFTNAMLLNYLERLGVDLREEATAGMNHGPGYLLKKHGTMPPTYREYWD